MRQHATLATFLILSLACAGSEITEITEPDLPPPPEPVVQVDADGNPVCPDGRTVFPFWAGEYPSPVIQIDSPIEHMVADAPCDGATRRCTIPAGLYHPWSQELPGGVAFGSRTAPQIYIAQKAHRFEGGTEIKAGQEVVVTTYLSEGFCAMEINGTAIEDMCPGTGGDHWTEKPRTAPQDDQVLKVPCDGGQPGWLVVDDAFIARPDVGEGEITGYGDVKKR